MATVQEYQTFVDSLLNVRDPRRKDKDEDEMELGMELGMEQGVEDGMDTGVGLPSPSEGTPFPERETPFPARGTPPLAEEVFKPDALAHPDNFDAFFQGVESGVIDALTLGVVQGDVPKGMAGGAGQLVGLIAGEIPFFLIGGTIAKAAVKGSVYAAKIAAKAPRMFGASVEVATAMGVDVGRSTIGGEEDVFTPLRIGANVALPFAGSLLRKAVKKPKPWSERTWSYIEGTGPTTQKMDTLTRHDAAAAMVHGAKEADLLHAFKALDTDDAQVIIARQSLYNYKSGDPVHIEQLMDLARQGAPMDDLFTLPHPDDIIDYVRFSSIPQGRNKTSAVSRWKSREGKDLSIVKDQLTARYRDAPSKGQIYDAAIPFEDTAAALRTGDMGELARPFKKSGSGYVRPPHTGADQVIKDTVIKTFPGFRSVFGGSGQSPEDQLEIARELLTHPAMIDIPIDKKSAFVRNYMDKMASAPIIDRSIVTALRHLQAVGPEGRQIAGYLENARRWSKARVGESHADINNAAEAIGLDNAKWVEVVRGLDTGLESSDKAVNDMIKSFRFHTEYISKALDSQGVKVKMADGSIQPLVGRDNFFPHKHDWTAVHNDQSLLERIAGVIEKSEELEGVVRKTNMKPKKMVEMYLRSQDNARMPRFQMLYERNLNLPGWLGDPSTAATRGKGYATDVMDSMHEYLENAYTMVSHNRHMGAPKGMDWADDLNFWSNLEPVHRKIKDIIEGAEYAIKKGEKSGVTLTLAEQAQFPNVAAVVKQARRDLESNMPGLSPPPSGTSTAVNMLKSVDMDLAVKGKLAKDVAKAPWKLQPFLVSYAEKGGDLDTALSIISHVQGATSYGAGRRNLSRRVRDFNIVTKLGVMVAENMGQISFTATKMGIRNTLKAVKDIVNPATREATLESVTRWGVLVEDAVKVLEAESGRNFTGRFLTGIGFRWSEKYLRATAAVAGKYHVEELLTKLAKGPGSTALTRMSWRKTVRQLDKYGIKKQTLIKEGTSDLTVNGQRIVDSVVREGTDDAMLKAVHELAGFEGARATQFLADVMDNPVSWQSPEGKMLTQFKNFVTNSTKFAMRDILDEIAHGNPGPAVRMLITGIAIGEITQDLKDVVTGRDPLKRGQEGYVRGVISEMFGLKSLPDNDQELFRVLGQKISTNDLASRSLENILAVGQMGMFWSMMQSAVSGGTLRVMQFAAGPTIDTALDVARGVTEVVGGDPDRLLRRGLREGLPAAGAGLPGPLPFAAAALGRHLQTAAVPTKPQQERSFYVTADEAREIAERQVLRRYNNVRAAAVEAVENDNQKEAIRLVSDWNNQLGDEMDDLIIMGALNMTTAQKISFSHDDLRRLLGYQPDVEATTAERVGGAFQNITGRLGQPLIGTP
jgi:hypothetical protein